MTQWSVRAALFCGIAAIGLLLTGCFTPNVGKDFQFKSDTKNGLVFAAVTVSGDRPTMLFMKYRRLDAGENAETQQIPVVNSLVKMDWNPKGVGSIPDDNPAGRMLAIELPPGRYEFYAWHGTSLGYSFWSVTPFSYQFESVAGRAVYVGNMHLRFDGRRSRISLVDSRERDVALMREKVPKVPNDRMDTKLMDLAPLAAKP